MSAAKAYIGQYGTELLQDCVQMHGGIGVTFEHDLHLFLRRHTVDRALYGTPSRAPPAPHRPRRGAGGGGVSTDEHRDASTPSGRGPARGSAST